LFDPCNLRICCLLDALARLAARPVLVGEDGALFGPQAFAHAAISMTRQGRVAPGGCCGIMATRDPDGFGTEIRKASNGTFTFRFVA
jgi:hypothetical protein